MFIGNKRRKGMDGINCYIISEIFSKLEPILILSFFNITDQQNTLFLILIFIYV